MGGNKRHILVWVEINKCGNLPMRAVTSLVARCEQAELGRQSGGFAPELGDPGLYHRMSSFRGSFGVLLLLPPPMSEFLCPPDRAAEGPCDGDGSRISSADIAYATAAPPLGLLPEPHRAQNSPRSQEFPSAHHVEVRGFLAVSSDVSSRSRLAIRGRCR